MVPVCKVPPSRLDWAHQNQQPNSRTVREGRGDGNFRLGLVSECPERLNKGEFSAMFDTIDAQTIPPQLAYQELLSNFLSEPLVLQKRSRKTGLVLEFSAYPDYGTPRKSFSALPLEIRELVIALRPVEMFLESALIHLREHFSRLAPVYNIYCENSPDKPGAENFDESYAIDSYEVWEERKYPNPVLIDGVSFYHENKMCHFALDFSPMNKYSEKVNNNIDKNLFPYFTTASLHYNKIVTELYDRGYLLFSGYFLLGAAEIFTRLPLPKGFQSVVL